MSETQASAVPPMTAPGVFRIRVRGRLEPRWADRLGGMSINTETPEGGGVQSVLVGRLADQAALSGVLNALHDLHLPLVSVESLEDR
jgi:hypothetical protein